LGHLPTGHQFALSIPLSRSLRGPWIVDTVNVVKMASTKAGHFLAKILELEAPESARDNVTRGESILSQQTTDSFVEEQPTTMEFLEEITPTGKDILQYLRSLFPFLNWIFFYNMQWFIGDLVAGECFPR
jgi:hypothetical protein